MRSVSVRVRELWCSGLSKEQPCSCSAPRWAPLQSQTFLTSNSSNGIFSPDLLTKSKNAFPQSSVVVECNSLDSAPSTSARPQRG